jgi:hypothetical protein
MRRRHPPFAVFMDVGRDTTVCTHDQSKPTVDTIFEANGKPGAAHKQAA